MVQATCLTFYVCIFLQYFKVSPGGKKILNLRYNMRDGSPLFKSSKSAQGDPKEQNTYRAKDLER